MRCSRSASLPTASRSHRIISKRCCAAKLTPPAREQETWKSSDRAIRPVPTPNAARSNLLKLATRRGMPCHLRRQEQEWYERVTSLPATRNRSLVVRAFFRLKEYLCV